MYVKSSTVTTLRFCYFSLSDILPKVYFKRSCVETSMNQVKANKENVYKVSRFFVHNVPANTTHLCNSTLSLRVCRLPKWRYYFCIILGCTWHDFNAYFYLFLSIIFRTNITIRRQAVKIKSSVKVYLIFWQKMISHRNVSNFNLIPYENSIFSYNWPGIGTTRQLQINYGLFRTNGSHAQVPTAIKFLLLGELVLNGFFRTDIINNWPLYMVPTSSAVPYAPY